MSVHLVIGASGLVGWHLVRSIEKAGLKAVGTSHSFPIKGLHGLDILDREAVSSLVDKTHPSVIYLTAAKANVDYVEKNPDEAYLTNVLGVCHVLAAANQVGAKLVFFSSDYIFDGENGPYREEDPAHPICEYGLQKLVAEHRIGLQANDYLIIRTTGVYGWEYQKKNFIYRLLSTIQGGQSIQVPVDQLGNPTYAPNLAQAAVWLAVNGVRGVCHLVGKARINRFDLACDAAKIFSLDVSKIIPVTTDMLHQTARRPLKAGLRTDKARAVLPFPLIDYLQGLMEFRDQLQRTTL